MIAVVIVFAIVVSACASDGVAPRWMSASEEHATRYQCDLVGERVERNYSAWKFLILGWPPSLQGQLARNNCLERYGFVGVR